MTPSFGVLSLCDLTNLPAVNVFSDSSSDELMSIAPCVSENLIRRVALSFETINLSVIVVT